MDKEERITGGLCLLLFFNLNKRKPFNTQNSDSGYTIRKKIRESEILFTSLEAVAAWNVVKLQKLQNTLGITYKIT